MGNKKLQKRVFCTTIVLSVLYIAVFFMVSKNII